MAKELVEQGVEALRFRMHEGSSDTTMKGISELLYPGLSELFIEGSIPEQVTHQKALD